MTNGQTDAPKTIQYTTRLGGWSITTSSTMSLTNRLTLVHADIPCWAVKSCSLVNGCDLLAGFCDFYLPLFHLTPSVRGSPRATWYEKTRTAGLQSRGSRMMIDSVVWAQCINVTETHRQPHSHVVIAIAPLTHSVQRNKHE